MLFVEFFQKIEFFRVIEFDRRAGVEFHQFIQVVLKGRITKKVEDDTFSEDREITRGCFDTLFGQNPPEEIPAMLSELQRGGYDVVYGHYITKQHSWFRNIGSAINDRMATRMLHKPASLYLSSFKVMNRFVVDQITAYRGPYPYIDGLIYRVTHNIGQVSVTHVASPSGTSRYNVQRLVRLWLNMFLNFSIKPLRVSVYVGLLTSCLSVFALLFIAIDKLWITPELPLGIPSVLGAIVLLSGIQLMLLGVLGEYLGRLYLDHTGTPQFIVRYVERPAVYGESVE